MKHCCALDVSVKETAVCIVDETEWQIEPIGLEAGPLSQWLYEGLAQA